MLAVFATAIYFVASLPVQLALIGAVVALHRLSGVPARQMLAPLVSLKWILLVIGVALLFYDGPHGAARVVLRLILLVLAAQLVTATTTSSELVDAFVAWLEPLRRFGVRPERVGLALAMALRFAPMLVEIGREVADAQKARGCGRSMVATAVPMIVRTLKSADEIADAIQARGFDSRD